VPNTILLRARTGTCYSAFSRDVIATFLPWADEAQLEEVQAVSNVFIKPAGQTSVSIGATPYFWVRSGAGLRPRPYTTLHVTQHTRAARVMAATLEDEQFQECCETEIEQQNLSIADRVEFEGICLRGAMIVKPVRILLDPSDISQPGQPTDLNGKIQVYLTSCATSHQRMKVIAATSKFLTDLLQDIARQQMTSESNFAAEHFISRNVIVIPQDQ
jgi:hypothetical protein